MSETLQLPKRCVERKVSSHYCVELLSRYFGSGRVMILGEDKCLEEWRHEVEGGDESPQRSGGR